MDIQDKGRFVEVGGHRLAKLSPNDRRTLLAPVIAQRRIHLKDALKEGGVMGQEFVNELDAFDRAVYGDGEFFNFVQSAAGRAAILELAATKANPTGAQEILESLGLDLDDDFALAAKVGGVKIVAPDPEKAAAFAKRQAYKQDLLDAGFRGDDFVTRLQAFDQALGEEPDRPSDAGS